MIFDHEQVELQRRIFEALECILHLLEHRLPRLHHTHSIKVKFTTGATSMNSVVLVVGQSTIASIVPLEADGTTATPGAVVSDQSFSISDPGISITPNADGTATISGTAATSGPISGTASATVTDQDGTASNFSQTFTVQVNAPTGRTASIGVEFTDPK